MDGSPYLAAVPLTSVRSPRPFSSSTAQLIPRFWTHVDRGLGGVPSGLLVLPRLRDCCRRLGLLSAGLRGYPSRLGGAEVHREQRAPTREGNPAHGTGDGAHDCHPTTLEEAGNVVHDHNLKFTLL